MSWSVTSPKTQKAIYRSVNDSSVSPRNAGARITLSEARKILNSARAEGLNAGQAEELLRHLDTRISGNIAQSDVPMGFYTREAARYVKSQLQELGFSGDADVYLLKGRRQAGNID